MSASDSPSSSRRVVSLLALMGLVAYALRTHIAIAQEYLAPELGLTMVQMGVISAWGGQLAYTLGQVPGGAMGDRHGARLVLAVASLGWAVASLASGAVMGSGMAAFAGLSARGCCSARRRRLPTRCRRRGHGSSLPHATDRDRSAPPHRGQGLSRRLLEALMSLADVQGLRRMLLVTRDAHGVYAKVVFTPLAAPDRFMERHRPNACRGPGAD